MNKYDYDFIGNTMLSERIEDLCENNSVFANELIKIAERYRKCDWGDVSEEDKILNDRAYKANRYDHTLAAYKTSEGTVWVSTDFIYRITLVAFPGDEEW